MCYKQPLTQGKIALMPPAKLMNTSTDVVKRTPSHKGTVSLELTLFNLIKWFLYQ